MTRTGSRMTSSSLKRCVVFFCLSRYRLTWLLQKKRKDRKGKSKQVDAVAVGSTLPSSLDFFGDHPHPQHKPEPESESESDSESDSGSSSTSIPAPPPQKITLTGSEPLPKSLHTNLPSLVNHESHSLTSAEGGPLLSSLSQANIHSLWGVQCAVGGCLLEDRDTLCVAPTGSGKTLSYVLPTIVKLREPARKLKGTDEGKGVRALVVVPTHDLAVQIQGVIKAVTRGRHWRSMVLTKATEKAVWESAPGEAVKSDEDGDSEMKDGEDSGDEEEDEDDNESTGSVDEFAPKVSGNPEGLGIDVLVATPERLHHLIDSRRISLAR